MYYVCSIKKIMKIRGGLGCLLLFSLPPWPGWPASWCRRITEGGPGRAELLRPGEGRLGLPTLFLYLWHHPLRWLIIFIKGHSRSLKPYCGDNSRAAESFCSYIKPQCGRVTSPQSQRHVFAWCERQLYLSAWRKDRRVSSCLCNDFFTRWHLTSGVKFIIQWLSDVVCGVHIPRGLLNPDCCPPCRGSDSIGLRWGCCGLNASPSSQVEIILTLRWLC